MAIETFKGQSDKKSEYARLLQFLESEAGKTNCFQLIEVVNDAKEERYAVKGRVNQYDISISNGKKNSMPVGFSTKSDVGLGKENFSLDAAKERFVLQIFKIYGHAEITDASRVAVQQELLSWPAVSYLNKFLPKVLLEVADVSKTTSINVILGRKTIGKGAGSSVHTAKHVAACNALGGSEFKQLFAKSGTGKSCGYVQGELACPEQENFLNMKKLATRNMAASIVDYGFDQDADLPFAQLSVERGSKTVDNAAAKVYGILSDLRLDGKTKKQQAAERRRQDALRIKAKKQKFLEGHPVAVLTGIAKKLELEMDCEFNEKAHDELHKCTITIDDIEITGKDTTRKLAKSCATQQIIPRLIKKNPNWFTNKRGIEEVSTEASSADAN